MPQLYIQNEFSKLKRVILGTPTSFGGTPKLSEAYDPKSKEHIINGTFPSEKDVTDEMDKFCEVLESHQIEVLRPNSILDYNQIFSRDIGCVIEDKFLVSNMIKEREREITAISHIIEDLQQENIVRAPDGVRFEGGDILPHNEFIFIGYSKEADFNKYKVSRTNEAGVNFIRVLFPNKHVKGFQLNKSDEIAKDNALHLDCCFQPFGLGHAIIHEEGFKVKEEYQWLVNHFGEENCLKIDKEQMYSMGANLFSIAPDHVISDLRFTEANAFLRRNGYKVSEIKYEEIAKMEGLLRCSTLPLLREK